MKNKFNLMSVLLLLVVLPTVFIGCNNSNQIVNAEIDGFYSEWMQYLSDDVMLKNVVLPGSHDSGTSGMANYAETQKHQIDIQMQYGVRYFDLRVSKKGDNLCFFHTFNNMNYLFKDFCTQATTFLEENTSEFLIFDFQHFKNNSMIDVETYIEKYLNPDEYAVKQDESIEDLTMGRIREKGYRYIIFWADDYSEPTKNYQVSRNDFLNSPYDSKINNQKSINFVSDFDKYFEKANDKAFFVLQAQHTCNYAKLQFNIRKRELSLRPIVNAYLNDLYSNSDLLEKTNIIMRDFITDDIETINIIIKLNIAKSNFNSLPNVF